MARIEKSDKKVQKHSRAIRLIVLVCILVLSTGLGILHQCTQDTRPVGVDALCPFGGIESAFTLITTGIMINRVAWSSFILLFATLFTAILFRRSFCGNFCPFGTLQELFGKIGRIIFKKRLNVPVAIDRPIRYFKYLVLIVFMFLSAWLGILAIRPYDPWPAYHHITSPDLFEEFTIGFIVLVISTLGSILYDRFFCKYICPMGAFLGLINRIGWFRIRRNNETCTHCKACNKVCPVNIRIEEMRDVNSSECINCNLCVNACPVKDTLVIAGPKKTHTSSLAMVLTTLGIYILVLGYTTATGSFQWTIRPLAETVTEGSPFDPASIKGSHTFQEVAEVSGIPKETFIERFHLSEDDFTKPIKDAAHREGSGFETEDVRAFVEEQRIKEVN